MSDSTPRTAQWQDDQDSDDAHSDYGTQNQPSVHEDLSSLSLGALRKARRTLAQTSLAGSSESESEEVSDSETNSSSSDEPAATSSKRPIGRKDKHSPAEITSKRAVTRRRTVVKVSKVVPRDPRFLSGAGDFSSDAFNKSYSFLADNRKTELSALRQDLKRGRKRVSSVPKIDRAEHETEINRLEMTIKRLESAVNQDRREAIEQGAMHEAKHSENSKRKEGKGTWYMKQSEKRDVVMRARFETLASQGGQRAVKKAIEKRQKKVNQKEKKARPFSQPPGKRSSHGDGPPPKRRKVGE